MCGTIRRGVVTDRVYRISALPTQGTGQFIYFFRGKPIRTTLFASYSLRFAERGVFATECFTCPIPIKGEDRCFGAEVRTRVLSLRTDSLKWCARGIEPRDRSLSEKRSYHSATPTMFVVDVVLVVAVLQRCSTSAW